MKLALIGDLHYSDIDSGKEELQEAHDLFHHTFLKKFLGTEADAHISIGDLTNLGTTSELQNVFRIINSKDINFYHVLGNHDLATQTRKDLLEITGQQRYHAITTDECVLVFLDTARELVKHVWDGVLDDEQLNWFEKVVQNSGTKPMLVFGHHPVANTTTNSDKANAAINTEIDMWKVLDQKKGIGVYFNGHTHIDSIVKQKNWHFVQVSACYDDPSFRIIDIDEEKIQVTPVDVTDQEVKESAVTVYTNINHFTHNPLARGLEADRQCAILLENLSQAGKA